MGSQSHTRVFGRSCRPTGCRAGSLNALSRLIVARAFNCADSPLSSYAPHSAAEPHGLQPRTWHTELEASPAGRGEDPLWIPALSSIGNELGQATAQHISDCLPNALSTQHCYESSGICNLVTLALGI